MTDYAEFKIGTPGYGDARFDITSTCMSNDGKFIVTAINIYNETYVDWEDQAAYTRTDVSENIEIWDISSQKVVKMISDEMNLIVKLSNDNKYLISGGNNFVKIWDTGTWEIINEIKFDDRVVNIIFSPNNRQFIISTSGYPIGQLRVFNIDDFRLKKTIYMDIFKGYGGVYPYFTIQKGDKLIFSHDGRYFIFSHEGTRCIIVWDTNSWELKKNYWDTSVINIVVSSRSNLIAIDKANKGISIINLENLKQRDIPLKGDESFKENYPLSMIFSPDNKYLFVHGGYIEEVKWDINGKCINPNFDKKKCLSVFSTDTMMLKKCYKNTNVKWMNFNLVGNLILRYDDNIVVIDIERWNEVFDIKKVYNLGTDIEYNFRNEMLSTNMWGKYIFLLHITKSSIEKFIFKKSMREKRYNDDCFEYDYNNEVGKYDFNESGNIELGGSYNKHGYNREGYDEDGLDEFGYDDDMNAD